jgi:tRNA-uridine 2-sulfurtransferase
MSARIAVAMSGGVDSSVVAKILKDEGHDLVGLFLKLWSDPTSPEGLRGAGPTCRRENLCCDYEALEDARKVAADLSIPFYVINAEDEFKKEVVDYFFDEYKNLRTPNPCVVCNKTIKFKLLLKKAVGIGCDRLATGHYARIITDNSANSKFETLNPKELSNNKNQICKLLKGVDGTKDQSYMLYSLDQEQLSKILFPLGEMTKKEVRGLATEWGLPVHEKPESQEVCFFADRDYRLFLRRYLPEKYFKPGDIVNLSGKKLGEHRGLINYTIGQRRMLEQGVWSKEYGEKKPLYVIGFDIKNNQLIVGYDKDVYKEKMIVANFHLITPHSSLLTPDLLVKIRYQHPAVECKVGEIADNRLKVTFKNPQRAITPGQSAVFYSGDEVLGGGVIRG